MTVNWQQEWKQFSNLTINFSSTHTYTGYFSCVIAAFVIGYFNVIDTEMEGIDTGCRTGSLNSANANSETFCYVSSLSHLHLVCVCRLESPGLKWLCSLWCVAATLVLLALPKLIIDNSANLDPQVGRWCVVYVVYLCAWFAFTCSWNRFLPYYFAIVLFLVKVQHLYPFHHSSPPFCHLLILRVQLPLNQ